MARRDATSRARKGKKSGKGSGFTLSGILDMASAGKESLDAMDAEIRIRVHVGTLCERGLVLAAKDALRAERAGGVVEVMGIDAPAASAPDPDAAVVLGGAGEPGAGALIRYYLACGVPCAFVSASALDAPDLSGSADAQRLFEALGVSESDGLAARLGTWLAGVVENRIALAANFAFCRPAVASRLISVCAAENAALGAIAFIPGSDFPVMTASQVKLALDIAAAHGAGLEPARAMEVAGVVGAGLAYRGAARTLAGLVPGLGWLLKAGVGYAGTVATGRAVQVRFEGVPRAAKDMKADDPTAAGALPVAPAAGEAPGVGRGGFQPDLSRLADSLRDLSLGRARRDRGDSAAAPPDSRGSADAGSASDAPAYLVIDPMGGGAHEG